eukprot:4448645-Lingulodinium_polyedra.AAC.1
MLLPCAPKAIGSGSAEAMIAALDFLPIVNHMRAMCRATQMADHRERFTPPFVLLLSLSSDQASANLKMVRGLQHQLDLDGDGQALLKITAHSLCLSHQLSLCSRSQYGQLSVCSSGSNVKFITGLSGFCHVFAKSSYLTRIVAACITDLYSNMEIITEQEATALGWE